MRTVSIPGGTATVRDVDDMTERQRRLIRTAIFAAAADALGDTLDVNGAAPEQVQVHVTGELGERMFAMRDARIVAAVAEWTLDRPLPTLDTVQDLPGGVYDALDRETTGLTAAVSTDFSADPDPQSPTPPSTGSDGPLGAEDQPTPTPPNGGASTSTASSTT